MTARVYDEPITGRRVDKMLGAWDGRMLSCMETAAQGQSKWLREDGDREWESRFGRDYNQANFGTSQYPNKASESKKESDFTNLGLATVNNVTITEGKFKNQIGGKSVPYLTYPSGPDEEELDGLNVEERKKRRGGPEVPETMDTQGGLYNNIQTSKNNKNQDAALSRHDCAGSSDKVLATPASQASQHQ
ncbi:hypothetical protein L6452_43980 [Arctium lappa]|uniref:Uncharacterized protein n=1 Tax=Arctium lappa TaxID=4217 RepID=A0ACB8XEY2_ARCLA|nr:hypothetical protein L6452_43980 [Arctium lappa]